MAKDGIKLKKSKLDKLRNKYLDIGSKNTRNNFLKYLNMETLSKIRGEVMAYEWVDSLQYFELEKDEI